MTVQELINKLTEVEDKSMPVRFAADFDHNLYVTDVTIENDYNDKQFILLNSF